jgi:acetyl esterase/lipase
MLVVPYGSGADQVGDLYLPPSGSAPLVCLFHGGFWREPYGRDELSDIAGDLCAAGWAVWNLEYSRAGGGAPPWSATLADVDALLARLPSLHEEFPRLDLARMAFAGHSAGGHLAFWAASRPQPVRPVAVFGLAPILDLPAAHAAGLGGGAVETFLGGSPAAVPERYDAASPHARLPLGVPQFVLHGDEDDAVPLTLSEAYVEAAVAAGDDARCVVLPNTGHMGFVDPASPAHATLRHLLARIAAPARRKP